MDKKNNNLILPYRMGAYRPAPLPYGGTRAFMRLPHLPRTFAQGIFVCVLGVYGVSSNRIV